MSRFLLGPVRLMPKSLRSARQRRLLQRLIAARKTKGATQTRVADMLGRPQSFVAKYEGVSVGWTSLSFSTSPRLSVSILASFWHNCVALVTCRWRAFCLAAKLHDFRP
ncbi:helix-turn-helix transcriptional regulator [Mesorhizobium sp. C416B]|uniref:helix-turn-helix transcriptional regulator n=1 Tax=Mesorhizobium sp. C416B TaxID=2956834 RepID=UPI00336A72AE